MIADPEQFVLSALQSRNRASAAACHLAREQEKLLAECTALESVARTCERLQHEATAAKAAEAEASDAARLVGEKLAEAQTKAADLEHALQQSTAREQTLRKENETLLTKLTEQLQVRAMAMDTEREQFEAEAAAAAAAASGNTVTTAATVPSEAPLSAAPASLAGDSRDAPSTPLPVD